MFSSKARYGLRAMAVLARHFADDAYITVDDIVETEPIPPKFLESILTELRKEGLLLSRRGPAGGYRLARAPEAISLAAVVRTLDGAFAPTTCARLRNPVCCEGCVDMEQCAIRPFARRVRDEMAKVLEGQSIRDLSEDAAHEGQSSKERAKP
jgi:Rrf2 family protein